nr:RNA-directed DNA polymerase, eukaryota [Tanacetum cinerariifolium]
VEVVNSPQEVHMEVPKGSIGQSVDAKCGSVLGVLEEVIRVGQAMGQWIKVKRDQLSRSKQNICVELSNIAKELESGTVSDTCLERRCALMGQLHDIKKKEAADSFQKSKVRWAIEGDENSSFFHGIINKKRSQLAIRGVFVDGVWQTDPVKPT